MAHRGLGQFGFADRLVERSGRGNELLIKLESLLDWIALGELVGSLHTSHMGAPSYPPVVMLKFCCWRNGTA
jgi:hypothetical protein